MKTLKKIAYESTFIVATACVYVFVVFGMLKVLDIPALDSALMESVNMLEESASNIEADMQELRGIVERLDCYENQGEWSSEYGCSLEVVQ